MTTNLIETIDTTLSFNKNTVRVVGTHEEPLFVVKDICDILGLSNPTETLRNVDEDYHSSVELRGGFSTGIQSTNVVNEAGLYQIIMRCRKAVAKPFQRWVCGEVLPSLRRKGEYKMNESYQLKLKELEEEKLKLEEENKALVDIHLKKDTKIKKLENKVLTKQKRKTYEDGKNCVYMIQDEYHKANRTYIIGKAIDLTQRLTAYNKSRDYEVIYYRNCNSARQMNHVEKCILFKLDKYREVSNRDRFILPDEEDIILFKDVIDLFVNAFMDVDESVDIDRNLTEDEIKIRQQEYHREYREDNKGHIEEQYLEYREDNKEAFILKDRVYRENNLVKIDEYQAKYREENKDAMRGQTKKYYEEHKEKISERNKKYREEHKEELKDYNKTYNEEHKEAIVEYRKKNYEEKKDVIIERSKEYYQEHKEYVLERTKKHYEDNSEKILAYQAEKVVCECGMKIQRNYMAKHKKTNIHKISLESKQKGVTTERTDKTECECGHFIRVGFMNRHKKSKIHEAGMKLKTKLPNSLTV